MTKVPFQPQSVIPSQKLAHVIHKQAWEGTTPASQQSVEFSLQEALSSLHLKLDKQLKLMFTKNF